MPFGVEVRFPAGKTRAAIAVVLTAAGVSVSGCTTLLSRFEPAREVVCLQSAKVAMHTAIAAAQAQARGASVVDARYRQDLELGCLNNVPGRYDVTLLMDGQLATVSVDAGSGRLTAAPETRKADATTQSLSGASAASNGISAATIFELSDAIALAEETNGKVLKVRLGVRNGSPGYAVSLVEQGKVRLVWLDRNSGAVSILNEEDDNDDGVDYYLDDGGE